MLAPFFLFAAFATAEPAPVMEPRLTVIAVDASTPEIVDTVGAKLRYATELHVAHTLETELLLTEVRVVSEGTAARFCSTDAIDYVLTVQAVTGIAPGPTPGIVPSAAGTIRLIASGTATVTAQLVICPNTLAAQAIASEPLPRGVSSMSEIFNSLAAQAAYRIIDSMQGIHISGRATHIAPKSRISIIASDVSVAATDSDKAVAEKRVVLAIESTLDMTEVAIVSDGSVAKLCAENATDYVLSVEAAVAPNYQVTRTTPPTFPGPVATFLTAQESTPQVSAALLRCPGTLIATSLRHAWKPPGLASPPIFNHGFSEVAQSVADEILAQIPG